MFDKFVDFRGAFSFEACEIDPPPAPGVGMVPQSHCLTAPGSTDIICATSTQFLHNDSDNFFNVYPSRPRT